jgi:serine protease AprX
MPATHFFRLSRRIVFLAAAMVVALAPPVWSQSVDAAKLDPLLQVRSRQLTGRSRVIVEFRGEPDARVISRNHGIVGRQLAGGRAQVADLDNTALATLSSDPEVLWVGPDHAAFPTLERTGAAVAATLARQQFHLTGKGIGVAIIDSGITAWHDDLYLTRPKSPRADPRVVHFRDFTGPESSHVWTSDQPSDDYGHGTHVAGIIAGNGFDSDGARTGMAPGVNLIGLKALDANGQGYISDVIAAIDYAIALKDAYNVRIINLSVASGVFESYKTAPLARAAKRAVDAGIVVIASAGNLGTNEAGEPQAGGITCPGNAPWVLTVGAASHQGTRFRSDDIVAAFSSRGPTWIDRAAKPDILAPGVGIESLSDPQSTLYSRYSDYLLDGTRQTSYKPYLSLTGTSMSAPVVAGAVALMLEANPDLTPNAVKAILEYTAEGRPGVSFLAQGAGMLNVLGAVRMASFFGTPGPVPTPGDTIESEWIEWSREIIWGNERVAGGVPLPGANAWALGVTWGAETTSKGLPIVWGVLADDNIAWNVSTDDNIAWNLSTDDNIAWNLSTGDNIAWNLSTGDNIAWNLSTDDNIAWNLSTDDNIAWNLSTDDNIAWNVNTDDHSILWGTGAIGQLLWPAPAIVDNRRRDLAAATEGK